jgi:hypothetical protein
MIRRLARLAVLISVFVVTAAAAQTVQVTTGEHKGFTRIALVLPAASDWQVTRTDRGYRLAVAQAPLRWNLADVFRPLTRERLAAIWVDPATGALELGVPCACHALPFEPRPGIVVIDLHDGPAPPGSAFERDAAGQVLPPLLVRSAIRPQRRPGAEAAGTPATGPETASARVADRPPPAGLQAPHAPAAARPATAGYDWLDLARPPRAAPAPVPEPPAVRQVGAPATAAPSARDRQDPAATAQRPDAPPEPGAAAAAHGPPPALEPEPSGDAAGPDALRAGLVEELARAAARGTIELATEPPPHGDGPAPDLSALAGVNLRVGNEAVDGEDPGLAAEGGRCRPDADVDLGGWGGGGPAAASLGERRQAVLGEFDTPDAAAVAALVRHYLYLGFGAEARQAAAAFAPGAADRALWDSLAHLVDGGTDPGGAFAGQAACDGWVALWAVLSEPALPPLREDAAVLRAFSALPVHLRRHLGPPLADRYLAAGDKAPAAAILAAIDRAPGDPGPAAGLLREDLAQAAGAAPDAAALSGIAASGGDPGVRATIDLIELAAAEGPVPADLALSAEALRRSREGTGDEDRLDSAIALARASQSDYGAAFAILAPAAPAAAPVWQMLADRGPDGAILLHAVRHDLPPLAGPVRLAMAARLLDLGLAEPALLWIGSAGDTDEARLLRGSAELARGDARAALQAVAGLQGETAETLRRTARQQLDPLAAGMDGDAAQRQRARRLARDWRAVAADGPEVWRLAAARAAAPAAEAGAGPLARGRALVEDSAAARAALAALLAATPEPRTADASPAP